MVGLLVDGPAASGCRSRTKFLAMSSEVGREASSNITIILSTAAHTVLFAVEGVKYIMHYTCKFSTVQWDLEYRVLHLHLYICNSELLIHLQVTYNVEVLFDSNSF
jgi:hypothetical protein